MIRVGDLVRKRLSFPVEHLGETGRVKGLDGENALVYYGAFGTPDYLRHGGRQEIVPLASLVAETPPKTVELTVEQIDAIHRLVGHALDQAHDTIDYDYLAETYETTDSVLLAIVAALQKGVAK